MLSFSPEPLAHSTQLMFHKYTSASFSSQSISRPPWDKGYIQGKIQGTSHIRKLCSVGACLVLQKTTHCLPRRPLCECQSCTESGKGPEAWPASPFNKPLHGEQGAREGRGTARRDLRPCPLMVPSAWARLFLQERTCGEDFNS